MPSVLRGVDRGTHIARRQLAEIGAEFRERRMSLSLSQAFVAAAARLSRSRYVGVEAGKVPTLTILEANRIAQVLGMEAAVRLYPGGAPLRDVAHAGRLAKLLSEVRLPLSYRLEVGLPRLSDRPERRAWDAMLFGHGSRTAVELEMRVRDSQAVERRLSLKRRDDPTDAFLLV